MGLFLEKGSVWWMYWVECVGGVEMDNALCKSEVGCFFFNQMNVWVSPSMLDHVIIAVA